MRNINKHIVHCSDSAFGDAKTIDTWHKERGWIGIGYHFVITVDGAVELGRPLSKIGAHCKGHNTGSIGTCLIGKNGFSIAQYDALAELDKELKIQFPGTKTFPHNKFNKHKTCPNFDIYEIVKK